MKKEVREIKSNALMNLEDKLVEVKKTREYLRKELSKTSEKEERLREKIRRQKKSDALLRRAERLRHLPKRK